MNKKHILINDKNLDYVNQVLVQHPELKNFSNALGWIIDHSQKLTKAGDAETNSNDETLNQRKLMAMSKEEALQTQLMVSLLTEFKVHVVGDVTENPVYIAAKSEADKRLNRAMANKKIFGNE